MVSTNLRDGKIMLLALKVTLIISPSISNVFSLKSTPMVASVFSGKLPPQKRNVRHVFPTLESPITMILNILFCTCFSMTVFWTVLAESCPCVLVEPMLLALDPPLSGRGQGFSSIGSIITPSTKSHYLTQRSNSVAHFHSIVPRGAANLQ